MSPTPIEYHDHDMPGVQTRSLRALLLPPFVASLAAAVGVLIVFARWRPIVWQAFVISWLYSTAITLFVRTLVPPTLRTVARRTRLPPSASLVIALLAAAAAGSLVGGALVAAVGLMPSGGGFWTTYAQMLRITAALVLVFGFGSMTYRQLAGELRQTRAHLRERELQYERATKQALEARLSSLESRVHPHFLFNALNSVSALIAVDQRRAERMVGRLADVLRSSLNLGNQRTVPLGQEMTTVRDYLEIEQERLAERLEYVLTLPADAARCLVPPFSVQCLVENAVKHGLGSSETGGRIAVTGHVDASGLHVAVRDSGAGFFLTSASAGHGLENLALRLETTFGPSAGLDVGREGSWCVVTLHLPAFVSEAQLP
jgi:two-component system, LytTR family, sensor histidine kinase AlgZ